MLCRVADSLFWLSRYLERAENTARIVDINLQLCLDADRRLKLNPEQYWTVILHSLGDLELYKRFYDHMTEANIADFLMFSRDNPSSAINCVIAARQNARMVQDQISVDMWSVVNGLYLDLTRHSNRPTQNGASLNVYERIKDASSLFVGVVESTFNHQLEYEFVKAGRCMERAEKTGRIALSACDGEPGDTQDPVALTRQLGALRACSASAAFQRLYYGDMRVENLAELLIFSRGFPRAMLFSLNQLQVSLHAISGCPLSHYSNEAERICGRLISTLTYAAKEEIELRGLAPFIHTAVNDIEQIALALAEKYMFFPVVDSAETLAKQ